MQLLRVAWPVQHLTWILSRRAWSAHSCPVLLVTPLFSVPRLPRNWARLPALGVGAPVAALKFTVEGPRANSGGCSYRDEQPRPPAWETIAQFVDLSRPTCGWLKRGTAVVPFVRGGGLKLLRAPSPINPWQGGTAPVNQVVEQGKEAARRGYGSSYFRKGTPPS